MGAYVKSYPNEFLRKQLEELGFDRDQHELRNLRTALYRLRMPPAEGSTADQLAHLLITVSLQREQESQSPGSAAVNAARAGGRPPGDE
jgi:hypothetical protein